MVYAPTGCGKTYFALGLANAVSAGISWLGWRTEQGRVVYFDGEMGRANMQRRIDETTRGSEIPSDNFYLVSTEKKTGMLPNLSDPKFQPFYTLESAGADLIILDNLITLARPLNNRDDDFQRWARVLEWVIGRRNAGQAVLIVHHSGKSGSQLGTSTHEVPLDFTIHLRPSSLHEHSENATHLELRWQKHRHFFGKDTKSQIVSFEINEHGICWDHVDGERALQDAVQRMGRLGVRVNSIAERFGLSRCEVELMLKINAEAVDCDNKKNHEDWNERNEEFPF